MLLDTVEKYDALEKLLLFCVDQEDDVNVEFVFVGILTRN